MTKLKSVLILLTASALALSQSVTSTAFASEPVPLEYFAVKDSMSNVQISPDGKYLAFMKVPGKGANPVVTIYETDDLSKKPQTFDGGKLMIDGFGWIGPNDMIVAFRGRIRKNVKGFNDGVFRSTFAQYNVSTRKFQEYDEGGLRIVDLLDNDPEHILVSFREGVDKDGLQEGKSLKAASYYKMNLKTGQKKLIMKGSRGSTTLDKYRNVIFDHYSNPRHASSFDTGSDSFIYHYRKPGESNWREIYRKHEDNFETFNPVGFVKNSDSKIYVIAHNGHDRAGLWIFNTDSKAFDRLVHRHEYADITGIRRHSNPYTNPDEVVGVAYRTDKTHIKYFDSGEKALYDQLSGLIPNAHNFRIVTISKDGSKFVVSNSGPKDPGSFYIYNSGQFKLIGKARGILNSKDLSDVKYIRYKARDGRTIPAYVTVPDGAGPHPLVVMPHGGPFIPEVVSFDPWGQMLANNGYMVLQPQYRGSLNYGLDHYKSAFINGGQGGKKMQDDKDDGVKHLISQGMVDPEKVAMFGWSYGGYAALIAAARKDQLYKCAIAGAAVADTMQQINYYRDRTRGTQKIEQNTTWLESVNPVDEVGNVNIPLFLIHGTDDQRVPFKHYKKYVKALEKTGIPFKKLELKEADHFLNTLTYEHRMDAYPAMIDFLKNDCRM